jgi:hypothetical protein
MLSSLLLYQIVRNVVYFYYVYVLYVWCVYSLYYIHYSSRVNVITHSSVYHLCPTVSQHDCMWSTRVFSMLIVGNSSGLVGACKRVLQLDHCDSKVSATTFPSSLRRSSGFSVGGEDVTVWHIHTVCVLLYPKPILLFSTYGICCISRNGKNTRRPLALLACPLVFVTFSYKRKSFSLLALARRRHLQCSVSSSLRLHQPALFTLVSESKSILCRRRPTRRRRCCRRSP